MFEFIADRFYYLTIILSNCTWNGSTFFPSQALFGIQHLLRMKIEAIENMEFRGIGCSMVRGDTNSLTLGISAGYFFDKQNLSDFDASSLRANIRSAISEAGNLSFSELRIETTMTGRAYE